MPNVAKVGLLDYIFGKTLPAICRGLRSTLVLLLKWLFKLSLAIVEEGLRVGLGLIAGFALAIWIGMSTFTSWFPLLVNASYALLKFLVFFVKAILALAG